MPRYRITAQRDVIIGCQLAFAMSMLTILTLTACGAGSVPTPTSPPLTATATAIPVPIITATLPPTPLPPSPPAPLPPFSASPTTTLFPTSPGIPCGQIEARNGVVVDLAAARASEDCFWRAYQRCAVGDQLDVVRAATSSPSYSTLRYRLTNTGGRCIIEASGSAVPVIRDPTTGVTTVGGAYVGGSCTGMTRDTRGDLSLTGCFGGLGPGPLIQ